MTQNIKLFVREAQVGELKAASPAAFFITMKFYIYILFSAKMDRFYVGYSSDPWVRLKYHLTNTADKYTGKAKDWELKAVFYVSEIEGEAMKMERFIKKQKSRILLMKMCDENFVMDGYLAQLVRVPHVRD